MFSSSWDRLADDVIGMPPNGSRLSCGVRRPQSR